MEKNDNNMIKDNHALHFKIYPAGFQFFHSALGKAKKKIPLIPINQRHTQSSGKFNMLTMNTSTCDGVHVH